MRKQVVVIGLGQFGMSVVNCLARLKVEVLAVDRRQELVDRAAKFASVAKCLDATDENALASLAPDQRDVCVCAIGNEAREASFICTALLKKLGAKRVIARSTDPIHEQILEHIAPDEIVNPEREFGERVAAHIAHEGVLGEYHLAEGVSVSELEVPEAFIGKTMIDLRLPARFGITVVGLRKGPEFSPAPDPHAPLEKGDVLILVSQRGKVSELMDRIS